MNFDKDLPTDSQDEKVTPVESVAEDTKVTGPPLAEVMSEPEKENSAGTIILQWLTYAFWGWMIVGVAYLVSITASYLLDGQRLGASVQEPIAYGIAAVLVLLPVALLCDIFYSKQEVEHKKGASSVVMVIHAVLFALLGIGALIAIAFSFVNMLLSGYHVSAQVLLITACFMFVLYFLVLVRTVKPFITQKLRFVFRIVMTVVVLGVCVWGIVGPVAATARTKDDRSVSQSLTTLSSAINSYASSKGSLPENLDMVIQERGGYGPTDWDTVKDVVDRELISYTPNTKAPKTEETQDEITVQPRKSFYYELCGTYKYDSKNNYSRAIYPTDSSDGYATYIEPSVYHAGKNCIKLKTTGYTIY